MIDLFSRPVIALRDALRGAHSWAVDKGAPEEIVMPLVVASRALDGVLRAAEVIGDDSTFWFAEPVHSALEQAKAALDTWNAWLEGAPAPA